MDLLHAAVNFFGSPPLLFVWGALGGVGALWATLTKSSQPFAFASGETIRIAAGLVVIAFVLFPFMIDGARSPRWAKTLEGGLLAFWKELGSLFAAWTLVCGLPLAAGFGAAAFTRRLLIWAGYVTPMNAGSSAKG